MKEPTHYEILEVTNCATDAEVREAYRLLISVWHPDRFPLAGKLWRKANDKTKLINIAYEILRTPGKRRIYDLTMSDSSNYQSVSPQQTYDDISCDYTNEWYLNQRIVVINGPVDYSLSQKIISQLSFLDQSDSNDIQMYINSPGGTIIDCISIYEAICNTNAEVATICNALGASAAAYLLCAGAKGKRYATSQAQITIYSPYECPVAPAEQQEYDYWVRRAYEIMAAHTGQNLQNIVADTQVEYWMSPEEAKSYGIIDTVL